MEQKNFLPMRLQLFAEENNNNNENPPQNDKGGNTGAASSAQPPQIDYEKLAGIISGKQTVTEETVLKNYFKNQGLSGEEMHQAIASFKEQKAKNTPDPIALQNQLNTANRLLLTEKINNQATLQAMALGIEAKSIPYIIKMADMSNVTDDKGNVVEENVKKAIEKVLEDVPALKGNMGSGNAENKKGGFHIGGSVGNNNGDNSEEMLRNIFGIKK